jgi:hypothetical protein
MKNILFPKVGKAFEDAQSDRPVKPMAGEFFGGWCGVLWLPMVFLLFHKTIN